MPREVTFSCPFEIPRTPREKYQFKCYLVSLIPQIGVFGKDGRDVGIGFIWETRGGLSASGGLNSLSRKMQRALWASGIMSRMADPYFLTQRIIYIRDGDPNVVFTLTEE